MIIVYFILIVLIVVFFTLGFITSQKEKRYNFNVMNQKKLETTSSSLNVEKLINELDENIEKNESNKEGTPVIIESTLLSETLEMDEEEI